MNWERRLILSFAVVGVNCCAVPLFTLFVHVFSLRLTGGIIGLRGGVEVKRLVTVVTLAKKVW